MTGMYIRYHWRKSSIHHNTSANYPFLVNSHISKDAQGLVDLPCVKLLVSIDETVKLGETKKSSCEGKVFNDRGLQSADRHEMDVCVCGELEKCWGGRWRRICSCRPLVRVSPQAINLQLQRFYRVWQEFILWGWEESREAGKFVSVLLLFGGWLESAL